MSDAPEDASALLDSLKFGSDVADGELPPPGTPVMVVRSLRLPIELDARVKAVSAERGVPASTLIREWIEQELAALDHDEPISRADALRALAGVRAVPRPAP